MTEVFDWNTVSVEIIPKNEREEEFLRMESDRYRKRIKSDLSKKLFNWSVDD